MTRKLKTIGLALVAVFAMSAVAASAAQAAPHEIVYPEGQATGILTGTNEAGTEDEFKVNTIIGLAAVKCEDAKYEATAANHAKEVTIHPTYSNCTAFGEPATVTTNHCAYIFKEGETVNGDAPVTVECENEGEAGESVIEINVPSLSCKMTIGAQHELTGGVHYTNVEGTNPKHVTIEATVGNIKIKGKDGAGCGFVTGNTGTYNGKETVKAYEDNGGTAGTTPAFNEGAQIGVEVK